MFERGFTGRQLNDAEVAELDQRARRCRAAVLTATTVANSGHPGGSFSSMEIYLSLYHFARLRPHDPSWVGRDRVVVSHGHTSPGVYVALADAGFYPLDEVVAHFRRIGSPFEGHVARATPGVEWTTGNLGQGLSAGVGFALASRMTRGGWHTYVAMSDAEQNKGQVAEARRLAVAKALVDLTVVVDVNRVQISGKTRDIMPVRVAEDFVADGWGVVECDGHDFQALYRAISQAAADRERPVAVLASTAMGKHVSFMENEYEYHGRALTEDEYTRAMAELGSEPDLAAARDGRSRPVPKLKSGGNVPRPTLVTGAARTYGADKDTDCRSAWGRALLDLAEANADVPIAVLDCDLMASVKTEAYRKAFPDSFIECGVGEHNAASVAGALSISGVPTFWADFGVFGIDEPYNMQRLNDINSTELKLVVTHCGLDVGEDGKTHHCLDYVGALRDFFGWKVVVPADPNQTDRAVRAVANMDGRVAVAMGRSKLPVVLAEDGSPYFGGDYEFRYGAVDEVRRGSDVAVVTMGTVTGGCVQAADALRAEGRDVGVWAAACPLHLDDASMRRICDARIVLTVEDHGVRTGLGASVAEWIALNGAGSRFVRLGVDSYRTSGTAAEMLAEAGIDRAGVESALRGL